MSNVNLLLLAMGTFSASRMFSGAVLVAVLLGQGISLATIGIAKSVQLMVSAFMTIPMGVFADRYGRKVTVLFACAFGAGYYALLLAPSARNVILGEALNGLTIACFSGAFDSWLATERQDTDSVAMSQTFAHASELSFLGMVVAGFVGSRFVFAALPISLVTMSLTGLLFFSVRETKALQRDPRAACSPASAKSSSSVSFLRHSFRYLTHDSTGMMFLVLFAAYTGLMQLIFQFWQPFFFDFMKIKQESTLGLIFSAFMICQFLIARIYRKRVLVTGVSPLLLASLSWIAAAFVLCTLLVMGPGFHSIVLFCIFQGLAAAGFICLHGHAAKETQGGFQATLFSSLDFVGRLVGGAVVFLLPQWSQFTKAFLYGWPLVVFMLLSAGVALFFKWAARPVEVCV